MFRKRIETGPTEDAVSEDILASIPEVAPPPAAPRQPGPRGPSPDLHSLVEDIRGRMDETISHELDRIELSVTDLVVSLEKRLAQAEARALEAQNRSDSQRLEKLRELTADLERPG